MMIGVTSAEAFVLLNNEEMEVGLETESRNKLVSDLVTSTFQHHQAEIFSAVITEYTDWAQVARHPITTRHRHQSLSSEGRQCVWSEIVCLGEIRKCRNKTVNPGLSGLITIIPFIRDFYLDSNERFSRRNDRKLQISFPPPSPARD